MAQTKKTPEVQAAILASIENGAIIAHAANAAGVGERTVYGWRDNDEQFAAALARARAFAANRRIRRIEDAGNGGDWKADAWLLERQFREYRQSQEVEVSGALSLEQILAKTPKDTAK